ncbi:MAG: hypothetical protein EXR36_10525 [Betaproteobacteria bacterium]|nr:hypothetical protein [Betaproteobacteria bacterium]
MLPWHYVLPRSNPRLAFPSADGATSSCAGIAAIVSCHLTCKEKIMNPNELSRRQFLKSAGGVAAGAIAAHMVADSGISAAEAATPGN